MLSEQKLPEISNPNSSKARNLYGIVPLMRYGSEMCPLLFADEVEAVSEGEYYGLHSRIGRDHVVELGDS